MFEEIESVISKINYDTLTATRIERLNQIAAYISATLSKREEVKLNFVCTHNSRRSQLAQIWAAVAAEKYNLNIESYSGGTETTAVSSEIIHSLTRFGFKIDADGIENPKYKVNWSEKSSLSLYSKLYSDQDNPSKNFVAIMTCSEADENCAFIPNCEKRIALPYQDPKMYDDTPLASCFYDYRSFEIATEMFYVFSEVN